MKKKLYVKPTSRVVVLKQRPQLMVGSLGDPSDYQNGGNPFAGN